MQKQIKNNNTMEIGIKRLEIIRTALSLMRDVLGAPEDTPIGYWGKDLRQLLAMHGIDYSEIVSLHHDITARLLNIKEMETL